MKRRMVVGVVLGLLATLATANRGQGQAPDKVAPDKVTSEFGPSSGIAPCSWYTTWGSVHDTPRSSLTRRHARDARLLEIEIREADSAVAIARRGERVHGRAGLHVVRRHYRGERGLEEG